MKYLGQVYMNISALTIEEAETILRVLEKAVRHYYELYGVHRTVSFSKRGNNGYRAQIRVKLDPDMWYVIQDCVT